MTRVYMDANATTPLLPEVMEAMRPYWIERFGNASLDSPGRTAGPLRRGSRPRHAGRVPQLPRRRGGLQLRRHRGRQHRHLRAAATGRSLYYDPIEHSAILRAADRWRSSASRYLCRAAQRPDRPGGD